MGILLIVMMMLARGVLVTGTAHKEAVADRDYQISYLRGALTTEQQITATQASTISEQKVSGELTTHILEAIRANQESPRAAGVT
ncbi:hypothetical protein [Rhodococcus sp. ARC_M6]|uniref:hypothetical protein n=1 Tax=Rhodococcus sp. ARC_M6 TaxID=2928852 RepID=UPI001FB2CC0C|nr:hypothetical protein [Rhodococcus sp. ARC_M6]MCJ0906217.1 hypothetical protein [Rhodococcus sp. ARC_M6]